MRFLPIKIAPEHPPHFLHHPPYPVIPDMIPWLLVGYMWLFVHRPHEAFTRLQGLRIVIVYMVFVGALWLITSPEAKRPLGNIFTLAVFLYAIALGLATLFSPFTASFIDSPFVDWLKYVLFFVIFMTSVKTERDLKIVATGFVIAFFLWMAHSYRGYLLGNVHYSTGAYRIVPVGQTFSNANDYGTIIACALPMIIPLATLCKKYWHYLFVIVYVLLTVRSTILTGSRTAFLMLLAIAILPVLFSRHRFKVLPFLFIAIPIGWFSMSETMQTRYMTIVDSSISEAANENMAGRTEGFWGGLENWTNYPIFGVGPSCHGLALGTPFRTHNLIGEVVGETGTIGTLAFSFLVLCFGINHYHVWKNYKYLKEHNLSKEGLYCWRVSLAVMYGVVMLQFQGLGLHNASHFTWLWFGAFQALATEIMQEKVNDAKRGKLLPSLPVKK